MYLGRPGTCHDRHMHFVDTFLLVICLFALTGCSVAQPFSMNGGTSTESTAQAEATPAGLHRVIDPVDAMDASLSRHATVTGYLVGPAAEGMAPVMEAVNKLLYQDLNTTLDIRYINWGELPTRYPLVLAAGEGVDWIYTANWCQYFTEAAKGAFRPLSFDELSRWMPSHMVATPEAAWTDAKVNGQVYMIPTATPDIKYPVMLLREDLRKKYNVPEVTRFNDLEPYLAALKQNEPDMIPIHLDNGYDVSHCRNTLMGEDGFLPGTICAGVTFNVEDPVFDVVAYTDEPALSSLRKASSIMKDWYDKGYTSLNPFSNNVRSKESFQIGKSGVGLGNLYDVDANIQVAVQMGFEVGIVPLLTKSGRYVRDPYINNGVAISSFSRMPERTMMVLDLLMEDPAYNNLVTFGMEGVHYRLDESDRIHLISSAPGESPIYSHTGFWFTNKNQWRPLANWSEAYAALRENANALLFDMPLSAFAFTPGQFKTELTGASAAFSRYGDPLAVGAVDDVDETLRLLANALEAAGVEQLKKEAEIQIRDYLASRTASR